MILTSNFSKVGSQSTNSDGLLKTVGLSSCGFEAQKYLMGRYQLILDAEEWQGDQTFAVT